MVYVPGGAQCIGCVSAKDRRERIWIGVGLAALVGAVTWGFMSKHSDAGASSAPEPTAAPLQAGYDYGPWAADVERLTRQVEAEPCDRHKILELVETMMRAGDSRGTVRRASAFLASCGDYSRLRRLTYAAHKQLGEFTEAIVEATRLIDAEPYESSFRGWRGLVHEQKGDLDAAVEDYRQALVLEPTLSDVPFNLANVLERQGKPCDAIQPLAQVAFLYPGVRNIRDIHARIGRLESHKDCEWAAGEGHAVIPRHVGQGVTLVRTRVNALEAGRFVLDTGASMVVISRSFARRIGLALDNAPALLAQTANGRVEALAVRLDVVEVQGLRARNVQAAVVEDLGDLDGLLGMSFLTRFDMQQTERTIELSKRKRKP